jgi:hypothetical protein
MVEVEALPVGMARGSLGKGHGITGTRCVLGEHLALDLLGVALGIGLGRRLRADLRPPTDPALMTATKYGLFFLDPGG